MPCDTQWLPGETLRDRINQVNKVVDDVQKGLVNGSIKVVVDKVTKAIAFQGLNDQNRNRVADTCIYKRIMASKGTAIARQKIAQAEAAAGTNVSKQAIAQGWHSHDGKTWHPGHK